MKIRILKLTPEVLMHLLQGKTSGFASNLPADAELLDLKLDLFSKQVLAMIRSDTFEDTAESYPFPEMTLKNNMPASKATPKHALTSKTEVKLESNTVSTVAAITQPSKSLAQWENEFSPDQRKLLSFQAKDNCVVVKPIQFLKAEWDDINEVVRSLGGKWVKGDIISYWEIPLQ